MPLSGEMKEIWYSGFKKVILPAHFVVIEKISAHSEIAKLEIVPPISTR